MSFLNGQQLNQKTVQSLSISIIINNRMYVFLIVIDTNVINSKGRLEEMNEIEELFHLGLIDINYTSVLPIELDKDFTKYSIKRKHKVSSYEPIFGSLFYGDSIPIEWAGRESKFNEIFEIVVGKKIREAKMNVDFNRNTFRDILNLDLCWINMADYFITNDKNLLNSRNKLYMNGYDVKIVNPKECLNELKTKGIEVRATGKKTIVEEAPSAYKNVDDVVEVVDKAGLSKKVCRMKPLCVIKG